MRSFSIRQLSLCLLCLKHIVLINSFSPLSSRPQIYSISSSFINGLSGISKKNNKMMYLQLSSKSSDQEQKTDGGDDSAESGMSFEDATDALREAEEKERQASRGAMFEEDARNFQAKKTEFDEMRARIRARASDLNMEKSVATAEAIKAATQRAQAGEEASTPTVDLSKFSSSLGNNAEEDPEDVLTDEQKAEIDKIGQLPILEQVMEEIKNTKFPTPGATLKQALLMLVIFVVTAGIILKADELLRYQITEWGFIPRSGEVLDYSDLTLPEGFTDAMTEDDLANL